MTTISPQTALVYIMVASATADHSLAKIESKVIADTVKILPVFKGFTFEHFKEDIDNCISLLEEKEGIVALLGLIAEALPDRLKPTAYTLACEVVIADRKILKSEIAWLDLLRQKLNIEILTAAAIEMTVHSRYTV